jgi:undecaprenyl-diphosphatase
VTHGTTYDPATEPRFSGRRMVGLIILGTIPLVIVGLLFRADLETTARNPTYIGMMLLVTGAGLAAAEFFGRRDRPVNSLGVRDALLVGVGQALAAIPGISRSGATIAAGLFVNMTREGAARFSFFLAAPAILGSAGIVMLELLAEDEVVAPDWGPMAVGTVVAFLSALVSIKFLMTLLQRASLRPFVIYCLLAGGAVVLARAFGL